MKGALGQKPPPPDSLLSLLCTTLTPSTTTQDGVISVKDIDLVMSEGLGMRYAFIGPMETMHLNAPNGKVCALSLSVCQSLSLHVCER